MVIANPEGPLLFSGAWGKGTHSRWWRTQVHSGSVQNRQSRQEKGAEPESSCLFLLLPHSRAATSYHTRSFIRTQG